MARKKPVIEKVAQGSNFYTRVHFNKSGLITSDYATENPEELYQHLLGLLPKEYDFKGFEFTEPSPIASEANNKMRFLQGATAFYEDKKSGIRKDLFFRAFGVGHRGGAEPLQGPLCCMEDDEVYKIVSPVVGRGTSKKNKSRLTPAESIQGLDLNVVYSFTNYQRGLPISGHHIAQMDVIIDAIINDYFFSQRGRHCPRSYIKEFTGSGDKKPRLHMPLWDPTKERMTAAEPLFKDLNDWVERRGEQLYNLAEEALKQKADARSGSVSLEGVIQAIESFIRVNGLPNKKIRDYVERSGVGEQPGYDFDHEQQLGREIARITV